MNLKSADLTTPVQKLIAAGLGVLGLGILYYALPPLVTILKNLWITIGLAVPLLFFTYNYEILWSLLKQASWEMTKKIVSSNKLWYMWQGYNWIVRENEALNTAIVETGAVRDEAQKKLRDLVKDIENTKKLAVRQQTDGTIPAKLRVTESKVLILSNQFDLLSPKLDAIEKQQQLLTEVLDNRVADAEILKQTLEAKQDEYEMVSKFSKASDSAMAFLKPDTHEMKVFKESLKQIDKSIHQYTSNIENFRRRVLPVLQQSNTQREVDAEEGRKLIEEFKQSRLLIPA